MRDSEYKVSRSWKEGDTLEGRQSNNNFKSLKVEDNQNNGMQAMAVAPVNGRGEVDTSKITIA